MGKTGTGSRCSALVVSGSVSPSHATETSGVQPPTFVARTVPPLPSATSRPLEASKIRTIVRTRSPTAKRCKSRSIAGVVSSSWIDSGRRSCSQNENAPGSAR